MSGHSHWSTIKRQKQSEDAKRGKIFSKLSRAITLAVREGGGSTNPSINTKLRLAVEQAQAANMPKNNIKRAIERAVREGDSSKMATVSFGGFLFADVVLIIEGITDNKRRTTAQIRNIIASYGGRIGSKEGAEPYFQKRGTIEVHKGEKSEEDYIELGLEAEANDVVVGKESVFFLTEPSHLSRVCEYLRQKGIEIIKSGLEYKTKIPSSINNQKEIAKLKQVLDALKENDDITKIYTNTNIVFDEK